MGVRHTGTVTKLHDLKEYLQSSVIHHKGKMDVLKNTFRLNSYSKFDSSQTGNNKIKIIIKISQYIAPK